jgi:Flp pilus assembly pilin Flp
MRLKGGVKMELVTKMFIRARESVVRNTRGQTMTEYALILAAIAVVVYGTYKALGNNIGSLANGVDSTLTNAWKFGGGKGPRGIILGRPFLIQDRARW